MMNQHKIVHNYEVKRKACIIDDFQKCFYQQDCIISDFPIFFVHLLFSDLAKLIPVQRPELVKTSPHVCNLQ